MFAASLFVEFIKRLKEVKIYVLPVQTKQILTVTTRHIQGRPDAAVTGAVTIIMVKCRQINNVYVNVSWGSIKDNTA